eukprot:470675-Rhodomonas_salina.1
MRGKRVSNSKLAKILNTTVHDKTGASGSAIPGTQVPGYDQALKLLNSSWYPCTRTRFAWSRAKMPRGTAERNKEI